MMQVKDDLCIREFSNLRLEIRFRKACKIRNFRHFQRVLLRHHTLNRRQSAYFVGSCSYCVMLGIFFL